MRTHNHQEYGHRQGHPVREDQSATLATAVAICAVLLAIYLVNTRLMVRSLQLLEVGLYFGCAAAAAVAALWYGRKRSVRRERAWPQPPVFVPMLTDQRCLTQAWESRAVVAGYDVHARPWFFTDAARRMQTILLGQSGSGKTTLLLNLAGQDSRRTVNGRHIPLIVFDGKGDQEFLAAFTSEVCRAGRIDQLRVIDPFHPQISSRFNPFFTRGSSRHELVNAFFASFFLHQDFFRAHQATYLSDVCRVLDHSGAVYAIPDVLVMARDELVMKEQIAKAQRALGADPSVSAQQRQNFEMSARNLLQSLSDRERVPKIQGLLNELMTFTEEELSVITNAYEDLLTIDEVIEQSLILFISLNANKNSKAVTALGRTLLESLRLAVGERYLRSAQAAESLPMVSIILDEFAAFSSPNFANLIQTARGSNVSLLVSLQSIPQLRVVSRNFGDEVSSAPNTIMLLRTRDEETARFFLNASARVAGERKTMTVEKKGIFEEQYREIGFGSITEIERTRAVDFQIKNLPAGQMQVLTTDNRSGTLHLHVHVRCPRHYRLAGFAPVLYPRLAPPKRGEGGANLRFRNPELSRRMGRIFARSGAL